MQREENKII